MAEFAELAKLTKAQQKALGEIYCDSEAYISKAVLDALESKGLIECQVIKVRQGSLVLEHKQYYIPLSVHHEVTQFFANQYDWTQENALTG